MISYHTCSIAANLSRNSEIDKMESFKQIFDECASSYGFSGISDPRIDSAIPTIGCSESRIRRLRLARRILFYAPGTASSPRGSYHHSSLPKSQYQSSQTKVNYRPTLPTISEDTTSEFEGCDFDFAGCMFESDLKYYYEHGFLPFGSAISYEMIQNFYYGCPEPQGNITYNVTGNNNSFDTQQGFQAEGSLAATGSGNATATDSNAPAANNTHPQAGGTRPRLSRAVDSMPTTTRNASNPASILLSSTRRARSNPIASDVKTMETGFVTFDTMAYANRSQPWADPDPYDPPNLGPPIIGGPLADALQLVTNFSWTQNTENSQPLIPTSAVGTGFVEQGYSGVQAPSFPLGESGATKACISIPSSLVVAAPDCVFSRLYNSNRFYQCGWTIQISVNATPGMSGILKLTAIPRCISVFDNLNSFSTPSVLLNLAEGNTATLILPPFFPRGAGITGVEDSWQLIVTQVTQGRFGLMAGQLNVNLAVGPRNSRFWLTAVNSLPQGLITQPVAGSGDRYAYSAQSGDAHPVVRHPVPLPLLDHLPGELTSFTQLSHIPSFFRQIDVNLDANVNGHLLGSFPISGAEILTHTGPLSTALRAFSQWRGDLIIDFVASVSQTASGRLIICYTPPGFSVPGTLQQIAPSAKHVWDLTSTSSVSILVPNPFPGGWVPSLPCQSPQNLVSTLLGFVSVFIENPLLDMPQSAEGFSLVAYIRAANNFEIRGCSPQIFLSETQAPATTNRTVIPPTLMDQVDFPCDDCTPSFKSLFAPEPQGDDGMLNDDDLMTYFSYLAPLNIPTAFPAGGGAWEMTLSRERVTVMALDAPLFLYGTPACFTYDNDGASERTALDRNREFACSPLSFVTRSFAAWSADLVIRLDFVNTQETPFTLNWAYLPPGSSQCLSRTVFASQYSGQIRMTDHASTTLYVPCMLARNVFQAHPPAFPQYVRPDGGNMIEKMFGVTTDDFGSFQFYVEVPTDTTINLEKIHTQVRVALRNFRGFGYVPQYSPAKTTSPFYPPHNWLNNSRVPAKRQGNIRLVEEPEEPVYVIRSPRLTFVHWAIRRGDKQISLSQSGLQAKVEYERCDGQVWATTTEQAWHMAVSLIGEKLPYHAFRNCTHFVESLTGYSLPNSGFPIALGLGAAALSCASVGVAKTLLDTCPRPSRQGPLDKTVEASENMMKAATIAHGAASSLENTMSKIQPTMDKLEDAAKDISKSINRVCDIGDKLLPAARQAIGETSGVVGKFFMWVTKIIGYIMIIFGSPTPLSIAGLITVIAADLAPSLVQIASNTSPIQSLVAWIATKLGIRVSASEIAEVFSEDEPDAVPDDNPQPSTSTHPDPTPSGVPEQQGVKDYNDWMNAFKNTDWAIDKILKIVEKILKWLGIKIRDDPATQLADEEQKIFDLYTDSIAASSHPAPNTAAMRRNISAGQKLLEVASKAKSAVHCQMVTQSLRNYTSRLTALTNNVPTPRPEPVVVYIYGPPGSGKSLMATLLASTLANELSGDPNDVFTQPPGGYQYFDGYHNQSVHLIDDIGQDPEGKDWQHFPQMVSTSPFKVPMAALEDKGILYTSRVIICTSNFSQPTRSSVRCAAALDRRLTLCLKCEPISDQTRLVVEDALNPDGPATRHFAADCPFVRLECCRLLTDQRNVGGRLEGRFRHLDDLVDELELLICSKKNNLDSFAHLIKPRKPRVDDVNVMVNGVACTVPPYISDGMIDSLPRAAPEPQGKIACSFTNPPSAPSDDVYEEIEVQTTIPSDVEIAIRNNKEIGIIKKLWSWRKPIFVGTAVLSVITSLTVLFSLTYSYLREKRQGAYTGTPAVKPKTPEPAPRKNLGPKPRRQGIVGYNPTIVNNVVGGVSTGSDGRLSTFTAIGVGQRFFVTADHVVLDDKAQLTIADKSYPARKIFSFRELCMLEAPEAPQMKCLDRFIKDCNSKVGYLVASFPRGPGFIQLSDASFIISDCPEITAKECYHYKCVSFKGLCGSPVILSTPAGPRLVGIHVAGVAGCTGYADPLVDFMDAFRKASPQSLIVDVPMPGPSPHIPRKSKLTHSPAWGAFEPEKEPAALLNHDRRLPPGVTVDEVAFSKQNRGDVIEPWPGLAEAADLYFSQCSFPKMKMLTMEEAINGIEGLDGIDMTQSAGYPWSLRTSRRELFTLDENGKYQPVPELEEEILKCLREPEYWYTTFLKDELRPIAKARAGKTRLVEAAPIHAIIAGRMVFGNLFALFHSNPGKFGSAVGCDPDFHWTSFAHSFKRFRNVWSLDYSCFDSTLPSVCFNMIAARLEPLIEVSPECHPAIVLKYLNTIRASHHVFGGRAYVMIGGMPSGAIGTSIFNSMINNISVLSALISRPDFIPTQSNYQILAYGDDVLYACTPDFHPRDLKAFYDKYTPYQVTPASKDGDFPETSSLADVTFLKRWFVPDETIPFYFHPVIEPATYEQSVMWSRGGDFQDTVTSLCFLAHHAGPTNYANWCSAVRDACIRNGYDPPTFLDYSYLQMRWMQVVSG